MLVKISTSFIRLTGLIFLLFGVACVIAPTQLFLSATGFSITHSVALIDIRATYGGMSTGVAVILFLLASSPNTIRAGLYSVLALMLGMAGGRIVGMLIAPVTNWVMLSYLILEIAAASVAAILISKGGELASDNK